VTYQPGLRIDFARRLIEVEAVVVLRQGPLELLACGVGTREHESIVAVRPRPLHIFQALGLIGLEPGAPARYDEAAGRPVPPTGMPLRVDIRHEWQGQSVLVSPEQWLLDANTGRPPADVRWVFAGSRVLANGQFGADLDGTVVCVVDFDTALIAVDALHSADNELLWLAANPDRVPPLGTPCTLVIRAAAATLAVRLDADGTFVLDGVPHSPAQLAELLKPLDGASPTPVLIVETVDRPAPDLLRSALAALAGAGIDADSIIVGPAPP